MYTKTEILQKIVLSKAMRKSGYDLFTEDMQSLVEYAGFSEKEQENIYEILEGKILRITGKLPSGISVKMDFALNVKVSVEEVRAFLELAGRVLAGEEVNLAREEDEYEEKIFKGRETGLEYC